MTLFLSIFGKCSVVTLYTLVCIILWFPGSGFLLAGVYQRQEDTERTVKKEQQLFPGLCQGFYCEHIYSWSQN